MVSSKYVLLKHVSHEYFRHDTQYIHTFLTRLQLWHLSPSSITAFNNLYKSRLQIYQYSYRMFIKDLTVENFNWTDNDYKAVHEHRLFIKSRIWDNDFSEVTTAADTIWLLPKTTLLAKGDAPGEYIINDDIVTPDILPDCIFKITGYSGVKFKRSNGKLLAVLQGAAPWPATVSASYWVYDGMYKKIDIALNSESSPQVPTPPEFLFDATDKTYKLALSHLYRIPRTPETGDDGKFLMATGGQLTWAPVVNKTVTSDGTIIVNTDESTYYLSLNQNS